MHAFLLYVIGRLLSPFRSVIFLTFMTGYCSGRNQFRAEQFIVTAVFAIETLYINEEYNVVRNINC